MKTEKQEGGHYLYTRASVYLFVGDRSQEKGIYIVLYVNEGQKYYKRYTSKVPQGRFLEYDDFVTALRELDMDGFEHHQVSLFSKIQNTVKIVNRGLKL